MIWSLSDYLPRSQDEAGDVLRIQDLLASGEDPWSRSLPLHLTGSAVVIHPSTARVLLRWHERQQAWLQVGGHADAGETDPFAVAHREAEEETGLTDLTPWPSSAVIHVVIVPVPPGKGEPAHHHADIRYVLATSSPDSAVPEDSNARLRWLPIDEAITTVGEDNLRITLERIAEIGRKSGRLPA